jgi:dethiobiotin synthetase
VILVVTGTDTGVGKTIVTAALAAAAQAHGTRVAVVKPAQTGGDADVEVVRRLAAPATAVTLAEYPDPLAPLTAARVSGRPALQLSDVEARVSDLSSDHGLVLVEGAGGLLVPLGAGWGAAELAIALRAPAVVVARAGLGTLNHTALTLEALARRQIPASVVIGAWPAEPELVHRTNVADLPELAGAVPDGVGDWPATRFRAAAPDWLSPALGGRFDPAAFAQKLGVV